MSVFSSFNLSTLGNQPTFFHTNGSSQLDLMLFNDESKVLRFNQIDVPMFSNHDLIFASFDFDMEQCDNITSFRDYNSMDVDGLLDAYNELEWLSFYQTADSHTLLEFFNTAMTNLYDDFVPTRVLNSDKKENSWFNSSISKAMVDRDLAYKAWKNSKLIDDHNLFKRLRNKVNQLIHNAKKKLFYSASRSQITRPRIMEKIKINGCW